MKYLFYSFIAVMIPYLGISFIKLDMNVAHWETAERGALVAICLFLGFVLSTGILTIDQDEEVT